MARNLFWKIIKAHDVRTEDGALVIQPDQLLAPDATATPIFLQLEAIGLKRVKPFAVVYMDHNTLQVGYRNADDHLYLRGAARRFGAVYSKPGNGICHQVHLENFAKPGLILLGSDSHTPTAGALGMVAIGSGGLDVATAMAGEPFFLPVPKVVGVRLSGGLPSWSSGKDVVLELLRRVTVKGGVGKVFEFFGPGVRNLTVFDRATICNMGSETGSTTSIFPSDEQARLYLRRFGRESDWTELAGDEDAAYDDIVEIDLSAIEPMVAAPNSPDNVKKISEVEGLLVSQVGIGSCTNSSYKDLAVAAEILKRKSVHPEVNLVVSPGSRRTLSRFSADGGLQIMIDAGARILENTCGPCNGVGQSPASLGVSLRTYNRNYKGRSGTEDAEVYLVSPETAAASAVTGRITDPRNLGSYPVLPTPDSFPKNDNMFIRPTDEPGPGEIVKGPNIRPIPLGSPFPEQLEFPVEVKLGDNVSTDHILPGGAEMLSLRSNIPASIPYVFKRADPDFGARTGSLPAAWAVVGGENYGQGSAREHAVMAPMSIGMKVVIAKSFARIYKQNMINNGVAPLVFANPGDYEAILKGDVLFIDHLPEQIRQKRVTVTNRTRGVSFETLCDLTPREQEMLLKGGLLQSLREKYAG